MSTHPEPLVLDLLLSEDERRPVTVNQHKLFLDSLLTPADLDEIDAAVAELRELEPEGGR
jgi:hypothetical protein